MVLMMIIITSMGFTNKANDKNTILIQAADSKISSITLSESADIITARLKEFSTDKFTVTVIPDKNQIQVAGINARDITIVESLMTRKGRIEFYRAYNQVELSGVLKDDHQLFSILNTFDLKNSESKVGCTSFSRVDMVNQFINLKEPMKSCRFVWSDFSDSTNVCLYGLKMEPDKGALLTGNDLESVSYKQGKASKYWSIEFSFKKPVVKLWSDITKQNINHAMAIVINDQVICTPVIRSVIESGKCSITGNFTENDVKLFKAFGKHGELPAVFKVVR